jgi:hypothetical protein
VIVGHVTLIGRRAAPMARFSRRQPAQHQVVEQQNREAARQLDRRGGPVRRVREQAQRAALIVV